MPAGMLTRRARQQERGSRDAFGGGSQRCDNLSFAGIVVVFAARPGSTEHAKRLRSQSARYRVRRRGSEGRSYATPSELQSYHQCIAYCANNGEQWHANT